MIGAGHIWQIASAWVDGIAAGLECTSAQLGRFARDHNLVRSLGRTVVYRDNAQGESFWTTMKVEFYDRYLWPTKAGRSYYRTR